MDKIILLIYLFQKYLYGSNREKEERMACQRRSALLQPVPQWASAALATFLTRCWSRRVAGWRLLLATVQPRSTYHVIRFDFVCLKCSEPRRGSQFQSCRWWWRRSHPATTATTTTTTTFVPPNWHSALLLLLLFFFSISPISEFHKRSQHFASPAPVPAPAPPPAPPQMVLICVRLLCGGA